MYSLPPSSIVWNMFCQPQLVKILGKKTLLQIHPWTKGEAIVSIRYINSLNPPFKRDCCDAPESCGFSSPWQKRGQVDTIIRPYITNKTRQSCFFFLGRGGERNIQRQAMHRPTPSLKSHHKLIHDICNI